MNADLSSIAELARLSPAERKRCGAIAREIDAADAEPGAESTTRALRLRNRLQENLGIEVSERQIYRYLKAYGLAGMAGLADTRKTPVSRRSLTDPRVLDLVENELKEQLPASTGTRSRTIARVRWEAARHDIPVPSRRTMYRILEELDRNRGSFGPATTRRSKAIRPDRTFHPTAPSRPGEIVEIDATPLDVFVQMPDGLIARPELTYVIDVATGTIAATLLHANAAKSVDIGAVLLTRMPADAAVVATLLDDAGVDSAALGINIVTLDGVTSIGHMFHLMKELGVASAYIVDKDYFLPYSKNKRDLSLDATGYPQY